MTRRAIPLTATLAAVLLTTSATPGAAAGGDRSDRTERRSVARADSSYRPDAWIKLCGLSLGCTIDPPPHPWLGKDVYNTTGRKQTVSVDIDNGEGVRFWITLENDGAESDTLAVQGCRGTRYFEVNRVLLGKHKDQDAGAVDLTRKYKKGTLTFDLASGEKVVFTLTIITRIAEGVTYRCVTAVHSANVPTSEDAVVAEMTTY
jgi:hypothetical protein